MSPVTLDIRSLNLSDEQFYQLCLHNRDRRLERNCHGDLMIMSPAGDETSNRNATLIALLWLWNDRENAGIVFDSSAGFILPNGATRSPDVAWIPLEKWQQVPPEQRQRFAHICPDFVIELRSVSDSLSSLQAKMQEYCHNGMQLGWLIDRQNRQVTIYRPGQAPEILDHPTLSGEHLLPGFTLALERIW
ncbi:MAG: Uma2 family endonuclease [Jaaginema sp. PMC 1078.18]|nr:Uma2 family endonuclease [Jaaginema sp. PMC 1078.18]